MSQVELDLMTTHSSNHLQIDSVPGPLSLELWEAIIDQLPMLHEGASLHACSLTCKAWIPRSRYHLFSREFYLYPDDEAQYPRIISISSTSVGTYLRILRIDGRRTPHWPIPDDESPRGPWMNKAILAMATYLVNVKDLGLYFLDWSEFDEATHTGLLTGFQNVDTLMIRDCVFTSLARLVTLIASFPVLKVLDCAELLGVDQRPTSLDIACMPASLDCLRLGSFPQATFVDWFLALNPIPEIFTLSLTHPAEQAPESAKLLKGLGPRIKHLTYGRSTVRRQLIEAAALKNYISIESNTNLRSIHLHDSMTRRSRYSVDESFSEWIPIILAQIKSTQLEEVRFTVSVGRVEFFDLRLLDWDKVDQILSQKHRFPCLARVRMILFIVTPEGKGSAIENVRKRLPILESRSMLLFE